MILDRHFVSGSDSLDELEVAVDFVFRDSLKNALPIANDKEFVSTLIPVGSVVIDVEIANCSERRAISSAFYRSTRIPALETPVRIRIIGCGRRCES